MLRKENRPSILDYLAIMSLAALAVYAEINVWVSILLLACLIYMSVRRVE